MLKTVLIFTFILLLSSQLVQGQELVTDRPDQTESSVTVPKGSLQIESGFLLGFSEENRFTSRELLLPSTLFRIGLTRNVELRITSQVENVKTRYDRTTGISDTEIGFKWQFYISENKETEIAFLSHVVLPTGSRPLSNQAFATINKLAFSHVLTENSEIGYNLGYNYFGSGNGNLVYSVSFGHSLNNRTAVFIEPYGEVANINHFILNADTGVTYLIGPNLQADFSFGTGLNQRMNYIAMGITWRILPG